MKIILTVDAEPNEIADVFELVAGCSFMAHKRPAEPVMDETVIEIDAQLINLIQADLEVRGSRLSSEAVDALLGTTCVVLHEDLLRCEKRAQRISAHVNCERNGTNPKLFDESET